MKERGYHRRGYFVVIDGLDGIGKGVVERALIEYEQKLGKAVFDTISFSRANRKGLPELVDFWNPPERFYDTLVTAEPTYTGIGHNIRNEIVAKNGRKYGAEVQMQAFAIDREIQMKRVVIPATENGLNVIQSRGLSASLTYQVQEAMKENPNATKRELWDKILSYEGNKLQLREHPIDLLIIPVIDSAEKVMERIRARKDYAKDDKTIFENPEFQEKLIPLFKDPELKSLFEQNGTRVEYLDAGISIEDSRRQAVEIYKKFLDDQRQY